MYVYCISFRVQTIYQNMIENRIGFVPTPIESKKN